MSVLEELDESDEESEELEESDELEESEDVDELELDESEAVLAFFDFAPAPWSFL